MNNNKTTLIGRVPASGSRNPALNSSYYTLLHEVIGLRLALVSVAIIIMTIIKTYYIVVGTCPVVVNVKTYPDKCI